MELLLGQYKLKGGNVKEVTNWLLSLVLSSEFLAALAGAVVGGLIAFRIQIVALDAAKKQREEDVLERKKGLSHAMLFKVIQIYSHFQHFHSHIEEHIDKAKEDGHNASMWQIVTPLGTGPMPVTFTADEMSLLLSLGNDKVFNNVISSDEVHNSIIDAFRLYHRLRESLLSQIPAQMQGMRGRSELTAEQMFILGPRMAELEALIVSLRNSCARDVEAAWLNVSEVQLLLKEKFGLSYAIERKNKA